MGAGSERSWERYPLGLWPSHVVEAAQASGRFYRRARRKPPPRGNLSEWG